MQRNIEVEIQTFLSPEETGRVRKFLYKHAKFVGVHRDSTAYFEKNGRIRVRVEPKGAFLVFKGGKMHDRHRKEIEIPFAKEYANSAEEFLKALGFPVVIRWLRKRQKWLWKGVTVTLDDTRGYGILLELEKMVSAREKGVAYLSLKERFRQLRLEPMTRNEMNRRFHYYRTHWSRLV